MATAPSVRELEHDGDRDEGNQQVRPALAGHEESQLHAAAETTGRPGLRRARGDSIAAVRRPSVALLATVLAALLIPAAAQAQAPRTVPSELDALLASGAIDQAHHDAWAESYDNAKATLKKLHGVRRRQLAAVIANTRGLAAAGLLIAARAPLVFLTLQRNRAWWSEGSLLRYGQRVRFAGSQLLWQYYPGQGIQVQWLGTFGRGDGLFDTAGRDADLRALLDEAVGLATPARRRHRVGVALPLRRGRAAVGQRPHAGHGDPALLEGRGAAARAALLRGRARRAGDLPRRAAGGRARRHPGRRALPAVLLRSRPAHHQRLHPGAQRALRLRRLRQRRRGARALRGRRGAGARRAADLRHGRVVAVSARSGESTWATTCSCATSCASCASASPTRRSTAPRPTASRPTCASRRCWR